MGADFFITQVGFDARKFDELLRYMRLQNLAVPVLGNVYVLSLPVARAMNRKLVPGCVVTDELFRQIEEEATSPDRGKRGKPHESGKDDRRPQRNRLQRSPHWRSASGL